MTGLPLHLADVLAARRNIAGTIRSTPLQPSASLSQLSGQELLLKLEHHQITGSFKLRGASNAVAMLSQEEKARGVIAVSSGNHGRGLAYAAKRAGVRCVICLSSLVPETKVEAIRALGAEVVIAGASQEEAEAEEQRRVAAEGLVSISPFDDLNVIAGQGTLGLDILEAAPHLQCLIAPLSGGGLIAGLALAAKAVKPDIRIIGVTMDRGPAMYLSLKAGRPVPVEELPTLADALGGGIGLDNRYSFSLCRDLVDEMVLVSEAEIAAAIRHAYWEEKQIIEGGAAVSIAALLAGKVKLTGPTAAILSGGNINMKLHHRITSGEDVDLLGDG